MLLMFYFVKLLRVGPFITQSVWGGRGCGGVGWRGGHEIYKQSYTKTTMIKARGFKHN